MFATSGRLVGEDINMNLFLLSPIYGQTIEQIVFFIFRKVTCVKSGKNSEFKSAVLCLKTDLVSHSARDMNSIFIG